MGKFQVASLMTEIMVLCMFSRPKRLYWLQVALHAAGKYAPDHGSIQAKVMHWPTGRELKWETWNSSSFIPLA